LVELLTPKQRAQFEERGAVDFAYDVGPAGDGDRFRINAFQHRVGLPLPPGSRAL